MLTFTAIKALIKALFWTIIGVVAGLALLLYILGFTAFFSQDFNTSELLNPNIVIFLCVTLMAGAGADFLLSTLSTWGWRITISLIAIFLGFIACTLFNPILNYKPDETALKYFEYSYCLFALVYCTAIKSVIFHEEMLAYKELNFEKKK